MLLTAGFFSANGPAPIVLLILSILVAVGGIVRKVPGVLHGLAVAVTTFERFVGNEDNMGVIDRMEEQSTAIKDIQGKLNGGGKIQPALERLETEVGHLRSLAEDAAFQAKQARLAASDAHDQAAELAVRMTEQNDLAVVQRGLIERRIEQTKDDLVEEMDRRTQENYRRLVEHGGPDLSLPVPPHVHDVSLPHTIEGDSDGSDG